MIKILRGLVTDEPSVAAFRRALEEGEIEEIEEASVDWVLSKPVGGTGGRALHLWVITEYLNKASSEERRACLKVLGRECPLTLVGTRTKWLYRDGPTGLFDGVDWDSLDPDTRLFMNLTRIRDGWSSTLLAPYQLAARQRRST